MLIYTYQKSKKKKVPQKQINQYNDWLNEVNSMSTGFSRKTVSKSKPKKNSWLDSSYRRETPNYPSANTGEYNAFKKDTTFYTGGNMKGIGTLHKSNAVPVFTDEEAKDQATMRR
jgi:hypothetical protein